MNLDQWIKHIDLCHGKSIDLGLDRIRQVAARLSLLAPTCPVIIVAGTNGKGSCVATLESIYCSAGYRVGTFTSPFLWHITEEIRLEGHKLPETDWCEAFASIQQAAQMISLTVFEYTTLAALLLFQRYQAEVIILEAGLGGRLDAVNIMNADVGIITSIDLDHQDFLGDSREKIALEKAGVFRSNKIAICGDINPPIELINFMQAIGCNPYHPKPYPAAYPLLTIDSQNAATALAAIECLQSRLPTTETAIKTGLSQTRIRGRYEVLNTSVLQIFDVAHNPAATKNLAIKLQQNHPVKGNTHAVFSMLADKDILPSIIPFIDVVDHWHIAALNTPRAASLIMLRQIFSTAGIHSVHEYTDIKHAHLAAIQQCRAIDRVIIFGSFHTVAATLNPAN